MKRTLSKSAAVDKINSFFKRNSFTSEETIKIKRLAMKYRIALKSHRKQFCKSCLNKLEGKIRISKTYKTIECRRCNYRNRFRL